MNLIILAAGRGTRLHPLTEDRPKCAVEIDGRSILDWQVDAAAASGIDDVVVVGGHEIDRLRSRTDIRLLENEEFASTNMVATLARAEAAFGTGFVMSYGDIVYEHGVLEQLLSFSDDHPVAVVVDTQWREYWQERFDDPLTDAESLRLASDGRILELGQRVTDIDEIEAQYIGLVRFTASGVSVLRDALARLREAEVAGRPTGRSFSTMYMTDLLQLLIDDGHAVTAVPIQGGWAEIDTLHDLTVASGRADRGLLRLGTN